MATRAKRAPTRKCGCKTPPKGPKTVKVKAHPRRKRRKLLKSKTKQRFPGPIHQEVCSILDDAAVYHWQRNLIAHGHYVAEKVSATEVCPVAHGTVKDRRVSIVLRAAFLERMAYELGFLAGRITDLSDETQSGRVPLLDRLTLQAFLRTNHPPPPIDQRIEPRHPTWRG